jgi:8-oxo-dGTP pyrophosphatase MutT (NUDIX family)
MFPPSIKRQINAAFSDKLELVGLYRREAYLEITGPMPINSELLASSEKQLEHLYLLAKQNERHAIVTHNNVDEHSLHLLLETLDFSHICSMRADGELPAVLSASAILVCSDSEELIVHQRSADVATHPEHWHIFGGAFNPTIDTASGQPSLSLTLQRELLEETGLTLSVPENVVYAFSKEKTTGFLQWCALGVPLSTAHLLQLSGSWEGSIHRVPFNQLPEFLQKTNWVTSGKAHILTWLALGAPHTKPGQKFGSYTPIQLFENLIRQQ